jgi:hypothetical protein
MKLDKATYKREDITNTLIGGYYILGKCGSTPAAKGPRDIWLVRCVHCSNKFEIGKWNVVKNTKGCTSCAAKSMSGKNSPHWKGYGDVPGVFLTKIRPNRKSRNLPINLTLEYLSRLWHEQRGKCRYTGISLSFGSSTEESTASLDRIDSTKGYIPENVQFVHKDINKMKWDLSEDRFLELCQLVIKEIGA